MSRPFVHLHLHTQYSLLDGAIRIAALPGALKERGYSACAITDHGNLYGAVEFYKTMQKGGIKPIIGMEAYVAEDSRHGRKYPRQGPNATHLVLLCQDREGFQNLMKLSSLAFLEGKYYGVPRMDRELLERYNGGLIALSSCLGGVINRPLLRGEESTAHEMAKWYGQVFDGRFYIELQDHGIDKQREVNPKLMAMAEALGLPLVGTNDVHYLEPDEAYAHWLLQLMGWQQKVTDSNTEPFFDKGMYLKTPDEMAETLAAYPAEALDNTVRIAEQCEVSLDNSRFYLPNFDIPSGYDEAAWFREQAQAGLAKRWEVLEPHYGIAPEDRDAFRTPYQERLDYELRVINEMRYAGYFLIVADFINWAKDHDVRVGPGRGSGAGSLVAYALRITDLDPIRHGLLFERFLNPERVSLPDFDIDFDVAGRERVIGYVREKYGADKVCQISTFGTLGAKAALRNVARVLDFPYSEADKIAKLIPNRLGITLEEAIEMEPALQRLEREGNDREQQLIRYGRAVEGLNHTLSTHAAGVIIMDQSIQEVIPVCTPSKGDGLQSQYPMKWAEDQGAVKFDFLGLLNLTIIGEALRLIDAGRAPDDPLDIDTIPLDDEPTYQMLGRGEATGVFQLESGGMRRLVMDMKPSCFEDIVAILALYRPGPLGSGMVADFVERKKGAKAIAYPHPLLEPVLKETYGVMVYQEQVIQAVQVLAGFSAGQADILRRAIGKKIAAELAKQREMFVEGCAAKDIPHAKANEIFDLIDYFSGYGFNKSHSAAYGLVAYQTAYLKCHYPVEYMAALLSSDMDNTDKVVNFITECRAMKVPVLPPDINISEHGFTVHEGAIRFGLDAVKNVGFNAVDVILEARAGQPGGRFADLAAFVKAVDLHRVNKRVLEALIKCGAFDSLEPDRAALLGALDEIVQTGLQFRNSRVEGQENLFDMLSEDEAAKTDLAITLPEVAELRPRERLKLEKEALGFYISGHPLDGYGSEIGTVAVSTLDLREGNLGDGQEATLAGVVSQLTVRLTRNAEKMAILRLQDQRGSVEVAVFPKTYAVAANLLAVDEPLLIRGRVAVREEEVSLQADSIRSLSQFRAEQALRLTIDLAGGFDAAPAEIMTEERLGTLVGLFSEHKGDCAVRFDLRAENGSTVLLDSGVAVAPTEPLMDELEQLLAGAAFRFEYPPESRPTGRKPANGNGYRGRNGNGNGNSRGNGKAARPGAENGAPQSASAPAPTHAAPDMPPPPPSDLPPVDAYDDYGDEGDSVR